MLNYSSSYSVKIAPNQVLGFVDLCVHIKQVKQLGFSKWNEEIFKVKKSFLNDFSSNKKWQI